MIVTAMDTRLACGQSASIAQSMMVKTRITMKAAPALWPALSVTEPKIPILEW